MSTEPSWDLFRTFAVVLREGSLSGAARVLGMTQPSVARHIDALEAAVGAKLFVRSQRGLSPTDRGLALRSHAESLVATSAALLRAASGTEGASGTVRITASEVVGAEHLPPILAALRRAHPALAIELVLSNAVSDLLQRQADIAVRMVEPTQQALVARKVGAVTLGFHAHRDYLAARGVPRTAEDLLAHDLIGVDTETPAVRAVLSRMPGLTREAFGLRTDSDLAQLAAIRAGYGIGVCQVEIARRDPALVRVTPDLFSFELPLWVVMHEDLRGGARYRAVFDALVEGLGRVGGG
ncbi:LysR family transcriptional regulator [Caulobacter segnis]|uniref:Transcriptional regulator, LysR family n=2 Tax=Caulobacter segnis TaxID=88688 RepID=D5VI02_CAUST|nr:LysR family transcriptional regulator [Caulobacter segnis]ADG09255.1 transcriptional regulator, LysR family [Caulobacter segnis ATCC 21756]AVQ01066.1 LysR family transcriptional regulator [Caulobacter segnis]